jgi:hypothetical protein
MKTMNERKQHTLDEFKKIVKSNSVVKYGLYAGLTVIVLYLMGIAFSVTAKAIRGFNELKSAINGK